VVGDLGAGVVGMIGYGLAYRMWLEKRYDEDDRE
jgi:hypothetical protein